MIDTFSNILLRDGNCYNIIMKPSDFQTKITWRIAILLAIVALGGFLRFWNLNAIPPGLYPDVAINGNDALTNPGRVFYPDNNGREGLFINFIALSFSLFGVSVWSIKVVAAIFGTLTLLGVYLMTKELFSGEVATIGLRYNPQQIGSVSPFRGEQFASSSEVFAGKNSRVAQTALPQLIALLATFFVATSFWHINFSRIGFRAILLPFVLSFSFFFLLRGLRKENRFDFIWAGILFGFGFYTYTSFRMAVLLMAATFILWWFVIKTAGDRKKFVLNVCYFLFFVFIVAMPIGFYFLLNPQDFIARAVPISVFAQQNPLTAFGDSLIKHLAMFNIAGDPNWRHNIAGAPELFWPVGLLFLAGFIICAKKAIWALIKKDAEKFFVPAFLFSWFFALLLPGILTAEGIPHSLRVIGVIPAVYIFSAIGGAAVYNLFTQKIANKKLLGGLAAIFLLSVALSAYYDYFIKWGQNKEVEGAFTVQYANIGNYLNSLSEATKKYVIVNEPGVSVPLLDGIPMPAQTPMFIERTKYGKLRSVYLKPEDISRIEISGNVIIVPMKNDADLASKLKLLFPQGKEVLQNGIWIFKIY